MNPPSPFKHRSRPWPHPAAKVVSRVVPAGIGLLCLLPVVLAATPDETKERVPKAITSPGQAEHLQMAERNRIATARRSAEERKASRVVGTTRGGTDYLLNELRLTLTDEFARRLSGAGPERRPVDIDAILSLHEAIARLECGHRSSRAWILGEPLPEPVRGDGRGIPRIVRNVTVILKPGWDAEHVCGELNLLEEVERASLKTISDVQATPNDPDFLPRQWGPQLIGMEAAWEILPRAFVRVAVIDTGVDLQHPDLNNVIVYHEGFGDFDDGDAPRDGRSGFDHGTHVAGIVAAVRNNGVGIAGMSNHMHLLVMNCAAWDNEHGEYRIARQDDAIDEAIAQGARVINCSFGGLGDLTGAVEDALENAVDHSVLVVVSAGNAGGDVEDTPWADSPVPFIVTNARLPAMTAVPVPAGTVEEFNPGSNSGPRVNLAAPGTDIWSTVPTWSTNPATGASFSYASMTGTSMAAPHVSGAAALIIAMNPGLIEGPAGATSLLRRMALDAGPAGHDAQFGAGLLRMDPAVLRTIRNADVFVSSHDNDTATLALGTITWPWLAHRIPIVNVVIPALEWALINIPEHSELCLSGGLVPGPHHYPALTITKGCTLTALPDSPVTIGQ